MATQTILDVPCWRIRPMPGQPREYFDPVALRDLARSIAAMGQVVPAQVAPVRGDKKHDYEIIDGQRRWHAAQMAMVPTFRCEVIDEPDEDRRYLRSFVANLSREANHPMEIATAIDRILRTKTIAEVAEIIGRSEAYVCQYRLLLRLVPDLKSAMHPTVPKNKRLIASAAFLLAKREPGEQVAAWEEIRKRPESVLKATQRVIAEMPSDDRRPKRESKPFEKYRVLQGQLDRVANDLDAITAEQFEHLTQGRASEDTARMRQVMERIGDRLEWMKNRLPGVRWENVPAKQKLA